MMTPDGPSNSRKGIPAVLPPREMQPALLRVGQHIWLRPLTKTVPVQGVH